MASTKKTHATKAAKPTTPLTGTGIEIHPDDQSFVANLVGAERSGNYRSATESYSMIVLRLGQVAEYRHTIGYVEDERGYLRQLIQFAVLMESVIDKQKAAETAEKVAMGVDFSLIDRLRPRGGYQLDSDIPF